MHQMAQRLPGTSTLRSYINHNPPPPTPHATRQRARAARRRGGFEPQRLLPRLDAPLASDPSVGLLGVGYGAGFGQIRRGVLPLPAPTTTPFSAHPPSVAPAAASVCGTLLPSPRPALMGALRPGRFAPGASRGGGGGGGRGGRGGVTSADDGGGGFAAPHAAAASAPRLSTRPYPRTDELAAAAKMGGGGGEEANGEADEGEAAGVAGAAARQQGEAAEREAPTGEAVAAAPLPPPQGELPPRTELSSRGMLLTLSGRELLTRIHETVVALSDREYSSALEHADAMMAGRSGASHIRTGRCGGGGGVAAPGMGGGGGGGGGEGGLGGIAPLVAHAVGKPAGALVMEMCEPAAEAALRMVLPKLLASAAEGGTGDSAGLLVRYLVPMLAELRRRLSAAQHALQSLHQSLPPPPADAAPLSAVAVGRMLLSMAAEGSAHPGADAARVAAPDVARALNDGTVLGSPTRWARSPPTWRFTPIPSQATCGARCRPDRPPSCCRASSSWHRPPPSSSSPPLQGSSGSAASPPPASSSRR